MNKTKRFNPNWITIGIVLFIFFVIVGNYAVIQIKKHRYPIKYEEYVATYADDNHIPRALIYAIIYTESGFDEDVVSPAGAIGLMQIMPETYDWLAGPRMLNESYEDGDIYKPENNIRFGITYLVYLYTKFGNWDTVLAGYNAGQGRVSEWLSDSRYTDDGKTLKEIPYPETKKYVEKVNRVMQIYMELYSE